MSRDREYAFRLFLGWLNERYRRSFQPDNASEPFAASDADVRLTVAVSELYEIDEAQQRVFTYIKLQVEDVFKGRLSGSDIVLKEEGGEAGWLPTAVRRTMKVPTRGGPDHF